MKISKLKMSFKIMKLFIYRIRKGMWYMPVVSEITGDELFDRINSNLTPLLIDLRSVKDFNEGYGHIPNAKLIPFNKTSSISEEIQSFKEKEIVTICPGGGFSLIAADILVKAGFKDVKSLKGGMNLWHKKGYPTTTKS